MTAYFRHFTSEYSKTIKPLLELLRKNTKWRWEERHEAAFNTTKELYSKNLHVFHPEKEGTYVLNCTAPVSYTHLDVYKRQVVEHALANANHRILFEEMRPQSSVSAYLPCFHMESVPIQKHAAIIMNRRGESLSLSSIWTHATVNLCRVFV